MTGNSMQVPSRSADFNKLLSVSPIYFFYANDIYILEPILDQLMYSNLQQLYEFPQYLFYVTQLLYLALYYFTFAYDTFATYFENSQQELNRAKQRAISLANYVNMLTNQLYQKEAEVRPTPTFVLYIQAVKEANEMLLRENYQLKYYMRQMVQIIQQRTLPTCQYCNKKFTNHQYLTQHVHRKHPELFDKFMRSGGKEQYYQYKYYEKAERERIKEQEEYKYTGPPINTQPRQPVNVNLAPTPYELEKELDLNDFDAIYKNFDELKRMIESQEIFTEGRSHGSVGEVVQ